MKIKVVLTLDYGPGFDWDDWDDFDVEDAIKDLKLEHEQADIIIEDYEKLPYEEIE